MKNQRLPVLTLAVSFFSACWDTNSGRVLEIGKTMISSVPRVGEILMVHTEGPGWDETPKGGENKGSIPFRTDRISFQWMRSGLSEGNFIDISYATGSTYIPVGPDRGQYIMDN